MHHILKPASSNAQAASLTLWFNIRWSYVSREARAWCFKMYLCGRFLSSISSLQVTIAKYEIEFCAVLFAAFFSLLFHQATRVVMGSAPRSVCVCVCVCVSQLQPWQSSRHGAPGHAWHSPYLMLLHGCQMCRREKRAAPQAMRQLGYFDPGTVDSAC